MSQARNARAFDNVVKCIISSFASVVICGQMLMGALRPVVLAVPKQNDRFNIQLLIMMNVEDDNQQLNVSAGSLFGGHDQVTSWPKPELGCCSVASDDWWHSRCVFFMLPKGSHSINHLNHDSDYEP